MKIYTISDFEKFEKVGKFIICPSGDYTQIKEFPIYCSFGEYCIFGKCCSFSKRCSFGERCRFGEFCSFGKLCSFGKRCSFGKLCSFGECCSFNKHCSFGEYCSFGESCSFGKHCSFGKLCRFGESCIFGESCSFSVSCIFGKSCKCENDKEFVRFILFGGVGSELLSTYCFLLTNNTIYVRCGSFAGTEQAFLNELDNMQGNSHNSKSHRMFFEAAKFELTDTNI